jgi:hypothetical protein
MRSRALEEVEAAKKKIAAEQVLAGREVESQTDSLASEIVRVILENPSIGGGAVR